MDPQPENIPDYPPNAKVTFLFTKTLTKTDINKGLVFVGAGNDYIRDLCIAAGIMETMQTKGITTAVYTPIGHAYMGLRIGATGNGPFWLKKNGWDKLLEGNGFKEGVKILCWGLYDATQPPEDRIFFLMRREEGLKDEVDKTEVIIKAEVD